MSAKSEVTALLFGMAATGGDAVRAARIILRERAKRPLRSTARPSAAPLARPSAMPHRTA